MEKRAVLDGVELEYEIHGDGEPVVLIHPGIFADWFTPFCGSRRSSGDIDSCITTAWVAAAAAVSQAR